MEKKHSQAHYKDNNVIIRDETTQGEQVFAQKTVEKWPKQKFKSLVGVFFFVFLFLK